jgi:hypothetical protein
MSSSTRFSRRRSRPIVFLRDQAAYFVARHQAQRAGKVFDYLELARRLLERLVRDPGRRARIKFLAESEADKWWRAVGWPVYKYILAQNMLDGIEFSTGRLLALRIKPGAKGPPRWILIRQGGLVKEQTNE